MIPKIIYNAFHLIVFLHSNMHKDQEVHSCYYYDIKTALRLPDAVLRSSRKIVILHSAE